jgi:hypothetical protein
VKSLGLLEVLEDLEQIPSLRVTGWTSGHLLFARQGELLAQPFDPLKLALVGEPFRVADSASINPGISLASLSASAPASTSQLRHSAHFAAVRLRDGQTFELVVRHANLIRRQQEGSTSADTHRRRCGDPWSTMRFTCRRTWPVTRRCTMASDRREFMKRAAGVAAGFGARGLRAGAQSANAIMPTPRAADLMTKFGLKYPIFNAGMGGNAAPDLAIAVSNAGGLGAIGTGTAMLAETVRERVGRVRSGTKGLFAINYLLAFEPVK